MNKTSMGVVST